MGGDYYEREVVEVEVKPSKIQSNSKKAGEVFEVEVKPSKIQSYSEKAAKTLNQTKMHKSNDPKRFAEEERQLINSHLHPIVFALDVSGSMGEWPKVHILYKTIVFVKKINRLFMINCRCFMVKS